MAEFYAIRRGNTRNRRLAGKPVSRLVGDGSAWTLLVQAGQRATINSHPIQGIALFPDYANLNCATSGWECSEVVPHLRLL